jgi:hypothetical protein
LTQYCPFLHTESHRASYAFGLFFLQIKIKMPICTFIQAGLRIPNRIPRLQYGIAETLAKAYDAVKLLADATGRDGSTQHAALRDALARTNKFESFTGTISFNTYG